jgi:subtilase family serine protease
MRTALRTRHLLVLATLVVWGGAFGCGPNPVDNQGLFSDNTTTGDGLPDLAIQNLSVSPTTLAPGEDLTIAFQVTNQGQAPSEPTRVGVYLADHTPITASDTLEGTMDLPSVGPGATISITAKGHAGQSKGLWYIGVFADDINRVPESNKANNIMTVAVVVSGP